jgi:SP family xylose:H+ symportor-like MFS transporter
MIIARVAFSFGLGPIPAVLAAEILPNRIRSIGMSVASSMNWLSNIIVSISFPSLNSLQPNQDNQIVWVYWVYSGILCTGLLLIQLSVVETKQRSLEEVETDFASSSGIEADETRETKHLLKV